ncbi:MAG: sel1 repeat family protein, partial [Deltaproteobacteria bacterium]|nr:sel1 repeat family protein [Deltaproteobacteria bacterium]
QDVPKDESQAVEWYRKAAEQGMAVAQYNLGLMYDHGRGVPKDEGQAMEWYRKAAEQGHAEAQQALLRIVDMAEILRKKGDEDKILD